MWEKAKEDKQEILAVRQGLDILPIDDEQIEYKVKEVDEWVVLEQYKETSWGREVYLVEIGEYTEEYGVVKDKAVIDKEVYKGLKSGEYSLRVVEKYSYTLENRIHIKDSKGYRIHHLTGQVYTGLEAGLINKSYDKEGGYISKELISILKHLTQEPRVYDEGLKSTVKDVKEGQQFKSLDGGWKGVKKTRIGGYMVEVEVEVKEGKTETLMVSRDTRVEVQKEKGE